MKKIISKLILSIFILSSIIFVDSNRVEAVQKAIVTGVDLGEQAGDKIVKLKTTLDQERVRKVAISKIREIRSYMYDQNVPLNGRKLQDVVRNIGYSTKEEYVNGFKITEELEKISIQRAIENALHGKIAHIRANQQGPFTAKLDGVFFNGEIIAWHPNLESAFDAWAYGELQALKDANGYYNSKNGHLITLIEPTNKSYGFSEIPFSNNYYYAVQLGVSSSEINTEIVNSKFNGEYILEVAVDSANYSETRSSVNREIAAQSMEIVYDDTKYEDYEYIATKPQNGLKEIITIQKTAYGMKVEPEIVENIVKNPIRGRKIVGTKSRWMLDGTKWKYLKANGNYAKSEWVWAKIRNNDNFSWKYFNAKGESINQLYTESGYTYLSLEGPNKGYQKGWWKNPANGYNYYFRTNSGSMVTGRQFIDGAWRYFRTSGTQAFGWQYYANAWRYNDAQNRGAEVVGSWKWLPVNGGNSYAWKYFNKDGKSINQFYKEKGYTYLSLVGPNQSYQKGWWKDPVNGQIYHFRTNSGSMVTGWQFIDGGWRYFRPTGTQTFGWQYIDGARYYLRAGTGTRVTGLQFIDGKYYKFSSSGKLL